MNDDEGRGDLIGGDGGGEGRGRVEMLGVEVTGSGDKVVGGREGEGRCGSHPSRQRKLDLEICLPLLIIVRHAAGRHKRQRDRSGAPICDCGAADRISVPIA